MQRILSDQLPPGKQVNKNYTKILVKKQQAKTCSITFSTDDLPGFLGHNWSVHNYLMRSLLLVQRHFLIKFRLISKNLKLPNFSFSEIHEGEKLENGEITFMNFRGNIYILYTNQSDLQLVNDLNEDRKCCICKQYKQPNHIFINRNCSKNQLIHQYCITCINKVKDNFYQCLVKGCNFFIDQEALEKFSLEY